MRRYPLDALVGITLIVAGLASIAGSIYLKKLHFTRGDFPPFYAAACLSSGSAEQLYSLPAQHEIELKYWPSLQNKALMFSYPAGVASILGPYCSMSASQAKNIHFLLMSIIFLVSLAGLWRLACRDSTSEKLLKLGFTLSLLPVLSGLVSGQFSPLVLLCFTACALALEAPEKHKVTWLFALVGIGVLFFKPNIALFGAGALFLLAPKERRASVGWAAMAGIISYWLIGVLAFGVKWPVHWFTGLKEFSRIEASSNLQLQMSLVDAVVGTFSGAINFELPLVALTAFSVLLLVGAASMLSTKLSKGVQSRLLVIISTPHLLYYDIVVLLPGLWLIPLKRKADIYFLLAFWGLVNVLVFFKSELPFQISGLVLAVYLLGVVQNALQIKSFFKRS